MTLITLFANPLIPFTGLVLLLITLLFLPTVLLVWHYLTLRRILKVFFALLQSVGLILVVFGCSQCVSLEVDGSALHTIAVQVGFALPALLLVLTTILRETHLWKSLAAPVRECIFAAHFIIMPMFGLGGFGLYRKYVHFTGVIGDKIADILDQGATLGIPWRIRVNSTAVEREDWIRTAIKAHVDAVATSRAAAEKMSNSLLGDLPRFVARFESAGAAGVNSLLDKAYRIQDLQQALDSILGKPAAPVPGFWDVVDRMVSNTVAYAYDSPGTTAVMVVAGAVAAFVLYVYLPSVVPKTVSFVHQQWDYDFDDDEERFNAAWVLLELLKLRINRIIYLTLEEVYDETALDIISETQQDTKKLRADLRRLAKEYGSS